MIISHNLSTQLLILPTNYIYSIRRVLSYCYIYHQATVKYNNFNSQRRMTKKLFISTLRYNKPKTSNSFQCDNTNYIKK